jgi:hypothetical protein
MLYNLFIGANNSTKEVEIDKIKDITGSAFDAFTIIPAVGFWKGSEEHSVIVQIESMDKLRIEQLATILKNELHQEAIAIQKLPSLTFI